MEGVKTLLFLVRRCPFRGSTSCMNGRTKARERVEYTERAKRWLGSEEADSKKDHSNRSSTVPLVWPFWSALCGTAGVPPKMGYSGVESGDLPIFFNKKSASPDPTKDRWQAWSLIVELWLSLHFCLRQDQNSPFSELEKSPSEWSLSARRISTLWSSFPILFPTHRPCLTRVTGC